MEANDLRSKCYAVGVLGAGVISMTSASGVAVYTVPAQSSCLMVFFVSY